MSRNVTHNLVPNRGETYALPVRYSNELGAVNLTGFGVKFEVVGRSTTVYTQASANVQIDTTGGTILVVLPTSLVNSLYKIRATYSLVITDPTEADGFGDTVLISGRIVVK